MNAVLAWIKSNVATVIFVVLMICALVSLPLVSGRLNKGVGEVMDARLSEYTKLTKLEKTDVSVSIGIGGEPVSEQALVNQKLVDRIVEVSEIASADATRIQKAAAEHNRQGRDVLMQGVFPAPPIHEREVMPRRFFDRLVQSYDQLLANINAGAPPQAEVMSGELEEAKANFKLQKLQKDESEALTDEEQVQLREELKERRLSRYAEEADQLGIYATAADLGVPVWEQASHPTLTELYDWQWEYWIIEDLLDAVGAANLGDKGARYSVQQAPVKRIVEISVDPIDADAAGGGKANPSAEVRPDFIYSFTGRVTNPLFDVRRVFATLVVETAQLPVVLDALAQENFLTVLDVTMEPIDQFGELRSGYFYGAGPLSQLTIELESVWLREWTTEFMPDDYKAQLGIPVAPGASEQG